MVLEYKYKREYNMTPEEKLSKELLKLYLKRENERRNQSFCKRCFCAWENFRNDWSLREFYKPTWVLRSLMYGIRLILKLPPKIPPLLLLK